LEWYLATEPWMAQAAPFRFFLVELLDSLPTGPGPGLARSTCTYRTCICLYRYSSTLYFIDWSFLVCCGALTQKMFFNY
jgi:hypothetical protein